MSRLTRPEVDARCERPHNGPTARELTSTGYLGTDGSGLPHWFRHRCFRRVLGHPKRRLRRHEGLRAMEAQTVRRIARLGRRATVAVPAACQNGAETTGIEQWPDDEETNSQQDRGSWPQQILHPNGGFVPIACPMTWPSCASVRSGHHRPRSRLATGPNTAACCRRTVRERA